MDNAVTFIVRATAGKNKLARCLNSIYRQVNKSFRVIVITNVKDLDEQFKLKYPGTVFINKKKADFLKAANKQIRDIATEYFMYVNSDCVFSPDAVDKIIQCDGKTVVFNVAKLNDKDKFKNIYPKSENFTLAKYISSGARIWNNAINTEYVLKKNLFLEDLTYFSQLMYLLQIFSGVKKVGIIQEVIAYSTLNFTKERIEYAQFVANRKILGKILKGFSESDMKDVKKQIINDFVFDNIDEYYNEKRFIFRLVKRYRFSKYICY